MDHGEPGLFDLPEPDTTTTTTTTTPPSRSQTGRNRQTWTLTVTADVSIIDPAAVAGATERYLADTVVIDAHTGSVIEDPAQEDAGPDPTHAPFDQLPWLIEPTEGLGQLMEQGALWVTDVERAAEASSADRGTATWSVTAKLRDVHLLRRLATERHPEDAQVIADSLSAAWQRAADPFTPLRSIPGIEWEAVSVDLRHVPARLARTR